MRSSCLGELEQIVEVLPDNRFDDIEVQRLVVVYGNIAEADHPLQTMVAIFFAAALI